MIDEEEIKKEFEILKVKLKFTSTYEQIEEHFNLFDAVNENKYISRKFSRQICNRMSDYLARWNEFIHRILMPNPNSIVIMEESKVFDDDDKKEIQKMFTNVMELISRNSIISISHNSENEAKWIDETTVFVIKTLKPKLEEMLKKINKMWGEQVETKKERPSYSG